MEFSYYAVLILFCYSFALAAMCICLNLLFFIWCALYLMHPAHLCTQSV